MLGTLKKSFGAKFLIALETLWGKIKIIFKSLLDLSQNNIVVAVLLLLVLILPIIIFNSMIASVKIICPGIVFPDMEKMHYISILSIVIFSFIIIALTITFTIGEKYITSTSSKIRSGIFFGCVINLINELYLFILVLFSIIIIKLNVYIGLYSLWRLTVAISTAILIAIIILAAKIFFIIQRRKNL